MRTFKELRDQLDEINFKADQKKFEIARVKIKNTEVFYHQEKKGSKKVRVWVKPKSAKEPEELGIFRDMKAAKKSAEQFVKLMGEDIDEGVSLWKELKLKAEEAKIVEITEADMNQKVIDKIAKLTDRNDHNEALLQLAKELKDRSAVKLMTNIKGMHKELGSMPEELITIRNRIHDNLMRQANAKFGNYKDVYNAF